jgi:hypothetical protein
MAQTRTCWFADDEDGELEALFRTRLLPDALWARDTDLVHSVGFTGEEDEDMDFFEWTATWMDEGIALGAWAAQHGKDVYVLFSEDSDRPNGRRYSACSGIFVAGDRNDIIDFLLSLPSQDPLSVDGKDDEEEDDNEDEAQESDEASND